MPDGGPDTAVTVAPVTSLTGVPSRARGAVAALMAGLFLAALDQTLFATALPTIAGDLGADGALFWVNTVTVLAGAVAMPVVGRLGDEVGRPRVFLTALGVLLVGSVLGGLAPDLPTLLGARALQGLGGGGMLVLVEAMVADLVAVRRRTSALGVVGAVFAVAAVSGPVLGGWLTQGPGWRWAFWANVPVALLAMTAAWFLLPRRARPLRRGRLPLASAALLAVAVSGLTLATSWLGGGGGRPSDPVAVAVVALTVALGYAFLRVDRRSAAPLLPVELFRSRDYTLAVVAGFVLAAALFGAVAYLPTHLQLGAGLTPGTAGLVMLALVTGLGSATLVAGQVVARTGAYRALPVTGAALGALALGALSTLHPDTSLVVVAAALALLGAGIGCCWEVLVVVAQRTVSAERVGVATAGNGFVRELGVLVGTAGVGAAYTARAGAALSDRADTAGLTGGSLTPQVLASLPTGVADGVRLAYTDALTPVLGALAPMAAAAAVLLLFLRRGSAARRGRGARP